MKDSVPVVVDVRQNWELCALYPGPLKLSQQGYFNLFPLTFCLQVTAGYTNIFKVTHGPISDWMSRTTPVMLSESGKSGI